MIYDREIREIKAVAKFRGGPLMIGGGPGKSGEKKTQRLLAQEKKNSGSSFVMAYHCHELGDKQWGTIRPPIDKFNS